MADHPDTVKEAIRREAIALGFAAAGFCRADGDPRDRAALAAYLADGRHGDMDWMARTADRRADPRALWPAARSVVVCALSYRPANDPLRAGGRRARGTISVYAQGGDYHDAMKKRLKRLAGWLAATHGGDVKVFVDTAPVMEKPLAARAGIGWQGKHTNLLSRAGGSWLFLGEVFTTLDLPPDPPAADRCGTCDRCRSICPTGALPEPYRIIPTRCISYLTIEHKGHVDRAFRVAMGNRVYGCDDCLAVCPWNKFAVPTGDGALLPRVELTAPRLGDLAELDDPGFRRLFAGTAIKRLGRDRFVRNVLIAIGNSGEPGMADVAERRLADPSPLVRAMAVWALGRLLAPAAFARIRARHRPGEADPAVRAEWEGNGASPGAPSHS